MDPRTILLCDPIAREDAVRAPSVPSRTTALLLGTIADWMTKARTADVQALAHLVLTEYQRRLGAEDEPSPEHPCAP